MQYTSSARMRKLLINQIEKGNGNGNGKEKEERKRKRKRHGWRNVQITCKIVGGRGGQRLYDDDKTGSLNVVIISMTVIDYLDLSKTNDYHTIPYHTIP